MAIPLAAILAAAPGVISAASDIIGMIKKRQADNSEPAGVEEDRFEELVNLIEKQAQVIEELAQANQQLALAVRNNRIISLFISGLALLAIGIAIFL